MKLSPQQIMRGLEMAFAASGKPSPREFGEAHASELTPFVPLRYCANGRGFEPVPIPGGAFYDPWAIPAKSPRDVKRDAARWDKADAVGITFPHGGPDWVLHPDTGTLIKFVVHIDGSLR